MQNNDCTICFFVQYLFKIRIHVLLCTAFLQNIFLSICVIFQVFILFQLNRLLVLKRNLENKKVKKIFKRSVTLKYQLIASEEFDDFLPVNLKKKTSVTALFLECLRRKKHLELLCLHVSLWSIGWGQLGSVMMGGIGFKAKTSPFFRYSLYVYLPFIY